MLKTELYILNKRVDLFDDEKISIVSSVQNIDDISRVFNDFSQSFTVPASTNNNSIFKHYYDANVNNGFDGRIRHLSRVEISGSPFKTGTIRLENVKINSNKPVHYKLTFFGQLIDLKQNIGEDYLNTLNLSEFDFDYTPANIKTALTTGLNSGKYIVPLISTLNRWIYNSNIASVTQTVEQTNIAWNGSSVDHGIDWTSLRPALLVMSLIEAIEEKYKIIFSRDFLGTEPFDDLFLWMANEDTKETLITTEIIAGYTVGGIFQPAIGTFDMASGRYTPTPSGSGLLRGIRLIVESSDDVFYTAQIMNGDNVIVEDGGTGDLDLQLALPSGVDPGSSLYARILATTDKTIDDANFIIKELSEDTVLFVRKLDFTVSGSTATTTDFTPNIKIMDFLKSIINMYNLVIVPNSETSFYINTLDKWYEEGKIYDISGYVDTSESTVSRSKIFREIGFRFQEPQSILAERFAETNNTAYGDLETKLFTNVNGVDVPLDGDEFDIEIEFEQMIYEKLLDLDDESTTNIVYGLSLDKSFNEVTPEAHLFYAISKNISANPIGFLDDTGTKSQINTTVYMPSHADSDSQKYSTCFGGEINEHTGAINNNSLFNLYYKDYVQDSFSSKRRKYNYTAILPIWLLSKLKLNDRLIINGNRYIINQMTTNVTDRKVDFELLNDIYNVENEVVVQEEAPPNPTPPPRVTPIQAKSFSISSTGANTRDGGCSLSVGTTKYWLGSEGNPTLADVIYNEQARTNKFNGGSLYYKIGDNLTLRISSEGVVIDVFDCTGGGIQ